MARIKGVPAAADDQDRVPRHEASDRRLPRHLRARPMSSGPRHRPYSRGRTLRNLQGVQTGTIDAAGSSRLPATNSKGDFEV
jgi:hypothetical protein